MKLFATLIAALSLSAAAHAAELPFTQAALDQALSAGKPVVVDFAADWCPICRAQKPVIQAILQTPAMADVTVLVADFDKETALKQSLHVAKQSTLVVFKGGKEVARSTGQTQRPQLEALLQQAL